jgi:tetratricopeptide (TPR) repeat protein
MYNLLISAGVMLAVFLVVKFAAGLSWLLSLLLAMPVFLLAYFLIARYVMKKVMAVMETANRDLQGQRVEKAIRELQSAFRYGKWQFYVTGQVNSQIGVIYYVKRDFSNAFPYLEKAFVKNWVAMGMLAITYMKRNKKEKMRETFEKAIRWSAKESLLWSLYAYCLNEGGDSGKAKEILSRGLKKLPGDERIMHNLEVLNEGKKMKMRSYGDMWLQFHLEKQSVIMKQQAAAFGGAAKRRIIRK